MTSELYWIPVESGRLAIMARPRSGDWLSDEVASWRTDGVDVVVSLLESHEARELELDGEATECAGVRIEFISFPIQDRGVPRSIPETRTLIELLAGRLQTGASIAIHCRAGIGRSALIAACTLTKLGIAPKDALHLIGKARRLTVPDTD